MQSHIGNRVRSRELSYGRVLYNRFRYYDPGIGRYISADPIGQVGGPNVYNYGSNNPANFADPHGLFVVTVPAAALALAAASSLGAACYASGLCEATAGLLGDALDAAADAAAAAGQICANAINGEDDDADDSAALDAIEKALTTKPTQAEKDQQKAKKRDARDKTGRELLEDADAIRRNDPDPFQNADKMRQRGRNRLPTDDF